MCRINMHKFSVNTFSIIFRYMQQGVVSTYSRSKPLDVPVKLKGQREFSTANCAEKHSRARKY